MACGPGNDMDTRSPDKLDVTADRKSYSAFENIGPRTRLIGGIAIALLIVLFLWRLTSGMGEGGTTPPPPPVHVARAATRTMAVVEHTVGTVIANAMVQVTARVDGELVSAAFTEGQIVQQGQLLFQLDERPFKAALDQATATRAKDEATLLNALAEKRRFDALWNENAISASQRDAADATAKSLAATVRADRAAIDVARLNLGYAQIRAPFTGKTGPILIQPGNLITANSANPLVTLTQVQPVKVSFALPQNDLPRIQRRMRSGGLVAQVDVHGSGGARLTAPVDFVSNAVSGQTGTIELRATFPNNDLRLVPGQLVDVTVTLDAIANAVVVPRDAVNAGPDRNFVYVVDAQSKVRAVPVDVLFDDGAFDAVEGDVKSGDTVVTEGQLRLVPGIAVAVVAGTGGAPRVQTAPGAQ